MPNEVVRRRKEGEQLAAVQRLAEVRVVAQVPEPVPTLRPGGALFMAGALALALYFLSRSD